MVNDPAACIMGKVAQTCDAICLRHDSGQCQHGLFSPGDAGRIREAIITVARAVAFFMESLDTTILNTAVPTIPNNRYHRM
jgi:hypothetical protein